MPVNVHKRHEKIKGDFFVDFTEGIPDMIDSSPIRGMSMFDDKYSPSPVRMERINKPNKPKEAKKSLDPIGDALEGRKLHGIGYDRTTY